MSCWNWSKSVAVCLALCACGQGDQTSTPSGTPGAVADSAPDNEASAPAAVRDPATMDCGNGGTACPAGLECLTWRGGQQACGPRAVPAVVMIKDVTLGGSCLAPTAADPYPGASIASVQITAVDGTVKGNGRMTWQQPGYEVAAERGTAPDGSAPGADACSASYNLGCDGVAVFEIVGGDGKPQPLREGENLVVHLRGQATCGEAVADEIEAAICTDPAKASIGDTASCTSRVRVVEARSDLYGPDRVAGTLVVIRPP